MATLAQFEIHDVGFASSPIIVHVPHAGTLIPDEERHHLLLDDTELALEVDCMTDWHTDRLAREALGASAVSATVFANRTSRLVVDPERFTDDTEPLAAIGMGAVYTVTSDLRPLRNPGPADEQRLLDQWFHPYAAAFTSLVDEKLAKHGEAVIVDLHSFPSSALPYEPDPSAARPGICLGTHPSHTHTALLSAAIEAFSGVAGGVAENTPFAGTYVPLRHLGRTPQVGSIMVEVRRDLYQVEPGGPLHDGYGAVVTRVAAFLSAIAGPTTTAVGESR